MAINKVLLININNFNESDLNFKHYTFLKTHFFSYCNRSYLLQMFNNRLITYLTTFKTLNQCKSNSFQTSRIFII